jgi:hypothetical protein
LASLPDGEVLSSLADRILEFLLERRDNGVQMRFLQYGPELRIRVLL